MKIDNLNTKEPTMKVTITVAGFAPVDVELDPTTAAEIPAPKFENTAAEIPAPKFKKGDWFVDPDDAGWTMELTGDGKWSGVGDDYPALSHFADGKECDETEWDDDALSDPGLWLPIPPKPTELPVGKVLTGEVRRPKRGEQLVYVDGNLAVAQFDFTPNDPFGGRRWIVTDAAHPAPRYKKGDWFTGESSGPTAYARLDSDGVLLDGHNSYAWTRVDGGGSHPLGNSAITDDILESSWLPIPPRLDKAPDGYEFTGEARVPKDGEPYVCDGNRVGVICTRGVDDTNEYCRARWSEASLLFFGGRRWILRKAEPVTDSYAGQWFLSAYGVIVECLAYHDNPPTWDMKLHTPQHSPIGTVEHWKAPFDNDRRIPPKPTVLPPGKKLTGKVIDISTCGPDTQWVSYGLGAHTHRGPNTISGSPYGHFRWEVVNDKPAPRLGFRVWEPNMKPDGRVMLRLRDGNVEDSVMVAAVNASGEELQTPNIAWFGPKGLHRCCFALRNESNVVIARQGDYIALDE